MAGLEGGFRRDNDTTKSPLRGLLFTNFLAIPSGVGQFHDFVGV